MSLIPLLYSKDFYFSVEVYIFFAKYPTIFNRNHPLFCRLNQLTHSTCSFPLFPNYNTDHFNDRNSIIYNSLVSIHRPKNTQLFTFTAAVTRFSTYLYIFQFFIMFFPFFSHILILTFHFSHLLSCPYRINFPVCKLCSSTAYILST
jgi:hypothetical protein